MSDIPMPPPTNGGVTTYRLQQMEITLQQNSQEMREHIKRFEALNTYLTGAGVKDSKGLLGQIADGLSEIAEELRLYHEEHEDDVAANKKMIEDEVKRQLSQAVIVNQASRWSNLSKTTKAVLIGVGGSIGASLTISSIVNAIHFVSGH